MKIELVKKISDLIDAYRATTTALNDDIKAVVDSWTHIAIQNKLDPLTLKESVFAGIAEARTTANNTAALLNQTLKLLIGDMKQKLLPDDTGVSNNRPADYAARVNNALQFLSYQLDDITDESAYLILKDFVNDYEQMRLFKNIIEKHAEIVDAVGVQQFPKTFGKLLESEVLLNTMNEIELLAENLFIHTKTDGQKYHFGNVITKSEIGEITNKTPFFVTLVEDGYEEISGEEIILKLAQDIEAMAGE